MLEAQSTLHLLDVYNRFLPPSHVPFHGDDQLLFLHPCAIIIRILIEVFIEPEKDLAKNGTKLIIINHVSRTFHSLQVNDIICDLNLFDLHGIAYI